MSKKAQPAFDAEAIHDARDELEVAAHDYAGDSSPDNAKALRAAALTYAWAVNAGKRD